MVKRIAAFVLMIAFTISLYVPTALAGSGPAFKLTISSYTVNAGDNVTCTLKAPVTASSVTIYMDGMKQHESASSRVQDGYKLWTMQLSMQKLGTHTIQIYVYGEDGKLLTKVPRKKAKIKVNQPLLPPKPLNVTFLEYDMAVVQAEPVTGIKYKKFGFYFGTSETTMNKNVKVKAKKDDTFERLVFDLLPNTAYYFQPYAITANGVLLKGEVKSFTTPTTTQWAAESTLFGSMEEKFEFLFGSNKQYYTTDNPPMGYRNAAEANRHMVTLRVPVWVLSHGKKKPSTWKLVVNRKLAESIKDIFNDIYALDIQFPIMYLKGYSYRKVRGPGLWKSKLLSHHSFGAAIDINRPYNLFYRNKDKRNPKNPYSIPQEVIDVFAKYGWSWGGNFDCGLDTMHFQYLGTNLVP